jgi:hypothetical protein
MEAGIEEADIYVVEEMDDESLVRVYARENATQRGNSGTSQIGSIASAIKYLARLAMGGGSSHKFVRTQLEAIAGNFASSKGIGMTSIARVLEGTPGINEASINQALANLKTSGNYHRIVAEVTASVKAEKVEAIRAMEQAERERQEANEALCRAEEARALAESTGATEEVKEEAVSLVKAAKTRSKEAKKKAEPFKSIKQVVAIAEGAEAASNTERTFDLEGCAPYFKNPYQLEVFRTQVTGKGVAPFLAVDEQANLAHHLVRLAQETGSELGGRFIKENITALIMAVKREQRGVDQEEQRRILANDRIAKLEHHQAMFIRACNNQLGESAAINDLWNNWPENQEFPLSSEFLDAIDRVHQMIEIFQEKTGYGQDQREPRLAIGR